MPIVDNTALIRMLWGIQDNDKDSDYFNFYKDE